MTQPVTPVLYKLDIAASAHKSLQKLPEKERLRVMRDIRALTQNPRPYGHIKLKSADTEKLYRIRCGNYRVIYEIHDGILFVIIVDIDHRKDVYR